MDNTEYRYVIVGTGLAGVSAAEGIREKDREGSILLIGAERDLPYDRPPLSKKLWTGKKTVEEIVLHPEPWYAENGIELVLETRVADVDAQARLILLADGRRIGYGDLLLATGGIPRTLSLPGSNLPGIYTYRTLEDYRAVRERAVTGSSALIIGGGFIGAEMAAALHLNGVRVTMIYPESRLIPRIFPEGLGRALQKAYADRGVEILSGQIPVSFRREKKSLVTATETGRRIRTDFVIAGIGVSPSQELAARAGLEMDGGIRVDASLRTSDPHIWAAGDNANFVYPALEERMRLEHWDNALQQGRHAGRALGGIPEPFTAMPYFFSDLFEFGFEAVGDVRASLETVEDWSKEHDTGVIFYMKDRKVRGAMMCNVWDKVEAARNLIRAGRLMRSEELKEALR
jgi:NADPH-dependent 2,4-dienoyl-CoA reductase/sulfur reductase-like enzyme